MALVCACTRFGVPSLLTRQTQFRLARFHTIGQFRSKLLYDKSRYTDIKLPSKRNYFWIFKRRTNSEVQLTDNPPKNCELIYRCTMDNLFLSFQHLGFYAVVMVCVGTLWSSIENHQFKTNLEQEEKTEPERTRTGDIALSAEDQEHLMFAAFFLVLCVAHWFISKVPVRIYYSPETGQYLMYLYKVIPSKVKIVKLAPGQLVEKTGAKLNLWRHEMYEHKETKEDFLLLEDYFKYPADLYVMLGQQPQRSADIPEEEPEEKHPK